MHAERPGIARGDRDQPDNKQTELVNYRRRTVTVID
jgi:hypothetical protein